ncbi:FHA domain-containing protein [Nocardioides sp. MAHUQ-72]|uniref:FHA domain-containing protein n=1 Tax=unclassified Nocardioides TaxID=2615069 RepID=UPI00360973CA
MPSFSAAWDGTRKSFGGDQILVIGRDQQHDITVRDKRVSRRHCELRPAADGWTVVDLDSRNGTWVDGQRLGSYDLRPGQTVSIALGAPDGPVVALALDPVPSSVPGHASAPGRPPRVAATVATAAPPARRERISIGREPDNDVVVADPLVSRHHAVVERESGEGVLLDLDSYNGTFLNGSRVEGPARLRPRDVVGVGAAQLRWDGDRLLPVAPGAGSPLVAEDLSVVTRGGKVLLDHVSLTLPAGTLTAVIGPSGAGKSTLLGALNGLRPATSGSVRWLGRDLYQDYDQLRLHLGYVPQEDIQHPQLKVGDSLRYAARLRLTPDTSTAELDHRVDEVVDEMQLGARLDQRIGSGLSGGQRKRVSIAMELLTAPPILFLDEPTSGLDPGLDIKVMSDLLRGLADAGRIVVVVTHSVLALEVCDFIVVMAEGGRVAYFGPPADLLEFFGVPTFAAVFNALESSEWPSRYEQSTARGRFVRRDESLTPAPVQSRTLPAATRQFRTLVARSLSVIAADRNFIVLLVAMPVVLAVLARIVPGHAGLSMLRQTEPNEVDQRLIILVLGAVLMGGAISVRELVKERAIFARERAVGLSVSAYLASKVAVLGSLAALQSILFVLLTVAGTPGPDGDGVIGLGTLEIVVPLALVSVAMVMAGLLISALVSSSEQTMPALVALVMLQLVLCGGLLPIAGRAGLEQLSWAVPGRFAFAASASSVGLESAPHHRGTVRDALSTSSAGYWTLDVVALVVLALVLTALTRWATARSIRRSSTR